MTLSTSDRACAAGGTWVSSGKGERRLAIGTMPLVIVCSWLPEEGQGPERPGHVQQILVIIGSRASEAPRLRESEVSH